MSEAISDPTKEQKIKVRKIETKNIIRTDLARVIAIIMVLLAHGSGFFISLNYRFFQSYSGQLGVAMFFICSGANFTAASFSLKKKFIKLYPAYILIFLIWNLKEPASPITFISYAGLFNGFYGRNFEHFWFVPALFGLYVLYPIIQKSIKYKMGIIFLISISFCVSIYTGLASFNSLSGNPYTFSTFMNPYTSSTLMAIFPFVLGMITKKVKRKYSLLILLFPLICLMDQYNLINNILFILREIFYALIGYGLFSLTANTLKTEWSNTTYILYLIHPLVMLLLFMSIGLFGVVLSIPLIILFGWYGTKLNNRFTGYLLRKIEKGNEVAPKLRTKAKMGH